MSKERCRELTQQGDKLFEKRSSLLNLWQTTAENFYPERADFTVKRSLGDEFAAHLMTGRPVMARRDLANSFAAMLRPTNRPWFNCRVEDERINQMASPRQWLDRATEILRRFMYDQNAQFVRSTKQGDNDFATFGQAVVEVRENRDRTGALYRCWHLRDTAWCENSELAIDTLHRNWSLDARHVVSLFPKTASNKLQEMAKKDPYAQVKCRHIVIPESEYDLDVKAKGRKNRLPYTSIYIDIDNDTVLEEVPVHDLGYVIPRWMTVAGSQYAYSPSTVVALPDARLIQQITLTLLEAGQKAVDPPMIAVGEMITGGVNTYAGGVTWVDADYDERLGEVLRPISLSKDGLNWGDKREEQVHQLIAEAFYLNQISVPYPEGDMTATEYRGRVEEYVRRALPLFEPVEVEYNGGICEASFNLAMRMGKFGAMLDMPRELRGQDVRFSFESPLQAATERAKSQAFIHASELMNVAAQIEPNVKYDVDVDKAFRDALIGTGAPSEWIVDEKQADAAKANAAKVQALQTAAATIGQGAQVAQQVGDATQSLQVAGIA